MRLWKWVAIKYGDNRNDEQKARDAALRERQAKALAEYRRHKKKVDARKAKELSDENVVELKQKRKAK